MVRHWASVISVSLAISSMLKIHLSYGILIKTVQYIKNNIWNIVIKIFLNPDYELMYFDGLRLEWYRANFTGQKTLGVI